MFAAACFWEFLGAQKLAEFVDWSTTVMLLAIYLAGGAIVAVKLLKYYLDALLYRVESVREELVSNGPIFRPIDLVLALPIACCLSVVSLVSIGLMAKNVKFRSLAIIGPVMWCAMAITCLAFELVGLPIAFVLSIL